MTPRRLGDRGWTIVELMMTIFIMGLVVPSLTQLFTVCYQGVATAEMHLQMKALNEKIHLHLHEQITSSKHMFCNDATSGGTVFLPKVTMGSAPATTSFCKLAIPQGGTTITFSPAAGAVSSSFGDALFYADADRPLTINGVKYYAPITISGAGVTNANGNACTVNLDVYRFYFDYLSSAGDLKPIRNLTSYWLIEWQSVQFVDAYELQDIGTQDSTLQASVIRYLVNSANFPSGQAVTFAFDPSQTTMTSGTSYAFYTLSGSTMTGSAAQAIPIQSWTPLSRTSSGLISNFNYGVPGNYTKLPASPAPPAVPEFCPAAGAVSNGFPGGLEVGIKGSAGGMQVMVRSLLVAQGNLRSGFVWDDQTSVSNARDIW